MVYSNIAQENNVVFLVVLSFLTSSPVSKPNPLNAYGETKLLGEIATTSASESHVILRIPILFGHVEQLDESAVTVLFKVG